MRKYRRSRRGRDWSKRSEREYIKRAPHRFPPLHDVEGECRLCRQSVPASKNGKPRRWHNGKNGEPNCWNDYRLMTRHGLAKQALARERGNACEKCGVKGKGRSAKQFHLDHVTPLINGANDEDRLRFFRLDNLQLLCEACHTAKTSEENSQRAAQRKSATALADAA
jgi:5-methylcytosine-specific restriction endonuclease McrA